VDEGAQPTTFGRESGKYRRRSKWPEAFAANGKSAIGAIRPIPNEQNGAEQDGRRDA
jgi:hypothetical protein